MEKSDSIAALAKALAAAQAEMKHAPKTATGQARGGKYQYATLADVLDAGKPALNKHGLALMQHVEYGDAASVFIRTTLLHESGEWVSSVFAMPLGPDPTPQTVGSAITYGRRYGLGAFLALASEEDDDGAAASDRPVQQARPGSAPAPKAQTTPKPSPKTEPGLPQQVRALFKQLGAEVERGEDFAAACQETLGRKPAGPADWQELRGLVQALVDAKQTHGEPGNPQSELGVEDPFEEE